MYNLKVTWCDSVCFGRLFLCLWCPFESALRTSYSGSRVLGWLGRATTMSQRFNDVSTFQHCLNILTMSLVRRGWVLEVASDSMIWSCQSATASAAVTAWLAHQINFNVWTLWLPRCCFNCKEGLFWKSPMGAQQWRALARSRRIPQGSDCWPQGPVHSYRFHGASKEHGVVDKSKFRNARFQMDITKRSHSSQTNRKPYTWWATQHQKITRVSMCRLTKHYMSYKALYDI